MGQVMWVQLSLTVVEKNQSEQQQLRSLHMCKLVREEGLVIMWMAGDLSVASSAVGLLDILVKQVLRHMGLITHVSSFS